MSPSEMVSCAIHHEADLLDVRSLLRRLSESCGLGVVDQTKFITAGSELARNIVKYAAHGGQMRVETLEVGSRHGLRATFSDDGPGIADVPRAMRDGYSSSGSLGIGLPGSKRLVDEFFIDSQPGVGTTVVIIKWCRGQ